MLFTPPILSVRWFMLHTDQQQQNKWYQSWQKGIKTATQADNFEAVILFINLHLGLNPCHLDCLVPITFEPNIHYRDEKRLHHVLSNVMFSLLIIHPLSVSFPVYKRHMKLKGTSSWGSCRRKKKKWGKCLFKESKRRRLNSRKRRKRYSPLESSVHSSLFKEAPALFLHDVLMFFLAP